MTHTSTLPPRRRRRRRLDRVLRGAVVFVGLTLVVVGSAYGYLRVRLGEITSLPCAACAVVADGSPYNVLVVGSDTRAGDTGEAAQAFGSASVVGGQRSDTIKIVRVDPSAGTAQLLSIPRDTYVTLSGVPADSGLDTQNKINAAFNDGPNALIQTIENTFGIPISHFVVLDFAGVIDMVNSVGGIRLDFPYPVRDDDNGNNNSDLDIPHAGCQTLNGTMALALARSRYYEYEVAPGVWYVDGSSDLGRIQRQNAIIEAVIDKARTTFDPLSINALIGSIVHDVTTDRNLTPGALLSLAQRYHAFSGSSLETWTLPTTSGYSPVSGDVQVVEEPAAEQTIARFLGSPADTVTTPPLDAEGASLTVPPATVAPSASGLAGAQPGTSTTVPGTETFDPTPC